MYSALIAALTVINLQLYNKLLQLYILCLLRPSRGVEYWDQPVCVCVCLSVCKHISGTAGPIGTKFCVQIPCGHGEVVCRQLCATLCTSGFMDDVTFGHNGHDAGVGWQHSAPLMMWLGWSLMSMNVC